MTSTVIGSGTAAALLSLFLTEIWRLIVTFSTWVAEKLNENLERSRERRRREREQHREKERQERDRIRKQSRIEGYEEGRKAGLMEAQGEQAPPPPWAQKEQHSN